MGAIFFFDGHDVTNHTPSFFLFMSNFRLLGNEAGTGRNVLMKY